MGQCSTLPSEARDENSNVHPTNNNPKSSAQLQPLTSTNSLTISKFSSEASTTPMQRQKIPSKNNTNGYRVQVQAGNQQSPTPIAQFSHMAVHQVQPPSSPQQREYMEASSILADEERDGFMSPPDSAIRTRCYKLNLESVFVGVTSVASTEGHLLGPFDRVVPPLAYSSSDDSSTGYSPTDVAVQTAQIFRGITVAKDGTILAQNARATRSNKGKKNQKGEQSRQAAKIDQAKDLVEESILTGKAPGTDVPANMVSLIIMGEYDDMKCLVRDGARKLRDASGLSDEALLAVNRPRSQLMFSPMSPSRKRVSPYAPSTVKVNSPLPKSPGVRKLPQSAPPKLMANPRDNRQNSRRFTEENRTGSRRFLPMPDPCNASGDSDWSSSLGLSKGFNSIWYCGGDATSPVQKNKQQQSDFENAKMVNVRMEPDERDPSHVARA